MKSIIYLISILMCVACVYTNKGKDSGNLTEDDRLDKGKNIKNEFLKDFKFDVKINDLEFNNPKSIIENVGTLEERIMEGENLPYVTFLNENKTEKLKVVLFPGSSFNDVYQFRVCYYKNDSIPFHTTKYSDFRTESGIKLGITKNELINIKGKGFREEGNALRYEIYDYEKPDFFKKYNLPIYYAVYTFETEKLIEFEFGFVYP
jgi:hypothetical protein